jgi:hypothetical protein
MDAAAGWEAQPMITLNDVQDFGTSWFDAVAKGATAAEQAQYFLDPHARVESIREFAKYV